MKRRYLMPHFAAPQYRVPCYVAIDAPRTRPGFLRGIIRQVCPRCGRGAIFTAPVFRAPFRMNAACPACGLEFDREHGYFTGAMYVTSALMIPPACLLYFLWLLMDWPFEYVLAGAAAVSLPLLPLAVRVSRVVWIYVDRKFDP